MLLLEDIAVVGEEDKVDRNEDRGGTAVVVVIIIFVVLEVVVVEVAAVPVVANIVIVSQLLSFLSHEQCGISAPSRHCAGLPRINSVALAKCHVVSKK